VTVTTPFVKASEKVVNFGDAGVVVIGRDAGRST
jgi:hypothetical protein